jgi:hypothetical protein
MIAVCLPAVPFSALMPMVCVWAWFTVQLLPGAMNEREQ